jgi:flagellar basal body-associated protein FliL
MRSEKKKSKKWLKITSSILLLIAIAGGAYGFTVYNSLKNAVETMHEPVERETEKSP